MASSLAEQIAKGEALRSRWISTIGENPQLRGLLSFVSRAQSEGWPDPATAGAALKALYDLALHLKSVEGLAAERERALWEGA